MYLFDIKKTFNPTASRVGLGKDSRLMRTDDGWTTNGYWCIRSHLEPKYVNKLNVTTDTKPDVEKVVKGAKARRKMRAINHFEVLNNGKPVMRFKNGKHNSWFNAYFIGLIDDVIAEGNLKEIIFKQKDELSPLVVKSCGEVMAMVMPVRMPEDRRKELN